MDREKAEVYGIVADIFCKVFLTIGCFLVFVVIVGFLLWKPNWYLSVPSAVLPGTMYVMIRHFFPAKGPGRAGPKKAPPKKPPTA